MPATKKTAGQLSPALPSANPTIASQANSGKVMITSHPHASIWLTVGGSAPPKRALTAASAPPPIGPSASAATSAHHATCWLLSRFANQPRVPCSIARSATPIALSASNLPGSSSGGCLSIASSPCSERVSWSATAESYARFCLPTQQQGSSKHLPRSLRLIGEGSRLPSARRAAPGVQRVPLVHLEGRCQ